MFKFGISLTMKKLNPVTLLVLALCISDIPAVFAVDLSGITPDDMKLFFNYLALTPALIAGMLVTPVALYHLAFWLASAIYSMFSR